MIPDFEIEQSHIRRATETEAPFLTELAIRSKGLWDYDQEFLKDCRGELTVTKEYVRSNEVFVIEDYGKVVGFYHLERTADSEMELVHLYIDPHAIGKSFGKQLLQHAVLTARQLGFRTLVITSDPFAESFYEKMGARPIGEVESPVRPGRMLRQFQLNVSE
jgi:N-acetylglutamate synthase-like GNAT family acetyltransferase